MNHLLGMVFRGRRKAPPAPNVSPTGILANLMATWLVKERPRPTVRMNEDSSRRNLKWVVATGQGVLVLKAHLFLHGGCKGGWTHLTIDELSYRNEPLRLLQAHERDLYEAIKANIEMSLKQLLADRRARSDMLAIEAIADRLGVPEA